MIPDLALIVGGYVIFRAIQAILPDRDGPRTARAVVVVLAVVLALGTILLCADIWRRGTTLDGGWTSPAAVENADDLNARALAEIDRQQTYLDATRAEHEVDPDPLRRRLHQANDDRYQSELDRLRRECLE